MKCCCHVLAFPLFFYIFTWSFPAQLQERWRIRSLAGAVRLGSASVNQPQVRQYTSRVPALYPYSVRLLPQLNTICAKCLQNEHRAIHTDTSLLLYTLAFLFFIFFVSFMFYAFVCYTSSSLIATSVHLTFNKLESRINPPLKSCWIQHFRTTCNMTERLRLHGYRGKRRSHSGERN